MKEKKIFWIIVFNIIIVVAEITFGIISNSYALIADALHNAGDVLAIVVTYIAIRLSSQKTTFKYTFGFLKAEMMAGFVNMIFLYITMIYVIYEAINRFINPQIIEPIYMIVVGLIAVLANGISAYFLNNLGVSSCSSHDHTHTHHHENVNIKSAYFHMLGDALISVGVVIAGICIYYFKIYYIDSILAIIFSLYILHHSYPLLKKSFLSLMDVNTSDISQKKLDEIIKENKQILQYHDLHISSPNSKSTFISFHIVLENENIQLIESEKIIDTIKNNLKKYGFNHIIIQVDTKKCLREKISCNINN